MKKPGSGSHQRNIPGIDFLRLSAALMVMFYHLGFWEFYAPPSGDVLTRILGSRMLGSYLTPYCSFGWVGVEIFFVISGFVIAFSAARATSWQFLRSRITRLYPAVWICATVSLCAAFYLHLDSQPGLLRKFLTTLTLSPLGKKIDGVYWTLAVETSFYALIFALVALRKHQEILRVMSVVGLASASFWLATAVAFLADIPRVGSQMLSFSWSDTGLLSLLHFGCLFSLGVDSWAYFIEGSRSKWLLCSPVLLCGSVIEVVFTNYDHIVRTHLDLPWQVPVLVFVVCLAAFAASIIYNYKLSEWLQDGLSRGSSTWNVARQCGLLTYPLYLLHAVLGAAAIRCFLALKAPPAAAWSLGVTTVLATALIISSYAEPLIQKHLRSLLDQWLFRKSEVAVKGETGRSS